jgi:hypothetical protein
MNFQIIQKINPQKYASKHLPGLRQANGRQCVRQSKPLPQLR